MSKVPPGMMTDLDDLPKKEFEEEPELSLAVG